MIKIDANLQEDIIRHTCQHSQRSIPQKNVEQRCGEREWHGRAERETHTHTQMGEYDAEKESGKRD